MKSLIEKSGGRKAFGFYLLITLSTVFYVSSNITFSIGEWFTFEGLDITFEQWAGLNWKLLGFYVFGNMGAKAAENWAKNKAKKQ